MKHRITLAAVCLLASLVPQAARNGQERASAAPAAPTATTAAPAATTLPVPPAPTTTAPAPVPTPTAAPPAATPRQTIPLAEARAAGLWGRPWPGCKSYRTGEQSPDWLTPALLAAAGWPEDTWWSVCRVASCESNWRADAYGPLGTWGMMQIMARSRPWSVILAGHGWAAVDLLDPLVNLTVAYEGYLAIGSTFGGDGGWTCARAARPSIGG